MIDGQAKSAPEKSWISTVLSKQICTEVMLILPFDKYGFEILLKPWKQHSIFAIKLEIRVWEIK